MVGAAGVGKSRLVAELLLRVDADRRPGPLPLLRRRHHLLARRRRRSTQLRPSLDDARRGASPPPLRALLDGAGAASTDELAWAFRKFVEAVARERPLVLVFDDIQWAEEALLDLIEHVAFVSSGAPILLLCMARPELLDRRPGWRGVHAARAAHPGGGGAADPRPARRPRADAAVSQRIVDAAEGNPLFVEELAAMLQEASDEQVALPPTIQALLAARLDQLDADERTVLEAAAVEGEVFHAGAVQALAPDEPRLTAHADGARPQGVHPARPARARRRGRLPLPPPAAPRRDLRRDPEGRALGPARAVRRLARAARRRLDAFVGYHLEQAYRYRVELRDTGAETDALARRASERLEARRDAALGRSDLAAAIGLLERAASPPARPRRAARAAH